MSLTATDAIRRLQRASSWRKKELLTLKALIPSMANSLRFNVMRGSLVLQCAHCEGFLRDATKVLLRHLEDRSPDLDEVLESYVILLKPDGLALPWSAALQRLADDPGARGMLTGLRRRFWLVGLDYSPFESHEKGLGELIRLRNRIAHGEKQWLTIADYDGQTERALSFIDRLEDLVVDTIRNERFLRARN